jgi:hypothetical protein
MARLERARIGWHRFERHDKPAFVRWRAREFGALLSKAREVDRPRMLSGAMLVFTRLRRHCLASSVVAGVSPAVLSSAREDTRLYIFVAASPLFLASPGGAADPP